MQKAVGRVIFIFGIPGSGKTTQARLLERAGFGRHLETSRIIQESLGSGRSYDILDDGTRIDLAQQQRVFDSGELSHRAWVAWLMRRELLDAASIGQSVILSGSPRTMQEAQELMPLFAEHFSLRSSLAVLLWVNESMAQERLQKRGRALDADVDLRFRRFREETIPVINTITSPPWSIRLLSVSGERPEDAIHEFLKLHLGGC